MRKGMDESNNAGLKESALKIELSDTVLEGSLTLSSKMSGLVIFAHGSGSSRMSPRNRFVASVLQNLGIGTLLFDLLTAEEERFDEYTGKLRFDIDFLSRRLTQVTDWTMKYLNKGNPRLGYFGASTGAAAALVSASERPKVIRAIVSRGGRPDLAGPVLTRVKSAVLLIVGGADYPVIEMNREALDHLHTEKKMVIIPRATHLFEELGALDEVARLAADWFNRYFK
jgi:putative phosphoribosyl transferase